MLTRLAAAILSLALVSSASARSFSQPPEDVQRSMTAEPAAAPSRNDVLDALAARRAHNLASFRAYRVGRVYPHNTKRVGPLNVWRDADGHLCAAATMIDRDGQHDLVMTTAKTDNAIRLLDVTDGPLLDWLMTSGFTLEEIDRIQRPMIRPVAPVVPDKHAYELETARLSKDYEQTERALTADARDGLELATDRLMTRPDLARALVTQWRTMQTMQLRNAS
jgi:hypothetical protein